MRTRGRIHGQLISSLEFAYASCAHLWERSKAFPTALLVEGREREEMRAKNGEGLRGSSDRVRNSYILMVGLRECLGMVTSE